MDSKEIKNRYLFLLALTFLSLPGVSFGWGGRGHQSICEASIFLLKNPELRNYLKPRTYIFGHLCVLPDADWKDLPEKVRRLGNPSHYMNPEQAGFKLQDVPLSYLAYSGKRFEKNLLDRHKKIGSNWWRANQFFEEAIGNGKKKDVVGMIHNLGLMGHFVADNSNIFHNVADYDGYESGHGGIHDFHETVVPGVFGPELVAEIVTQARVIEGSGPEYLKARSTLEAMKALALSSVADQEKILISDPIVKKSSDKVPGVRKSPETVSESWKPLIIGAMARAALLQAKLMDEAYIQTGSPELGNHHMAFPFRLPFRKPDYLPTGK